MARKIDKGRATYTYAGSPKSYWDYLKGRKIYGKSETEEMARRRRVRLAELDAKFQEVKKKRLEEKRLEREAFVKSLKR